MDVRSASFRLRLTCPITLSVVLLPDILLEIFKKLMTLSSYRGTILNCRPVCKTWTQIFDSREVWSHLPRQMGFLCNKLQSAPIIQWESQSGAFWGLYCKRIDVI